MPTVIVFSVSLCLNCHFTIEIIVKEYLYISVEPGRGALGLGISGLSSSCASGETGKPFSRIESASRIESCSVVNADVCINDIGKHHFTGNSPD